jgi:hypothetical protein
VQWERQRKVVYLYFTQALDLLHQSLALLVHVHRL